MRFTLDDRMMERASGRELSGGLQEVTEAWTFIRARARAAAAGCCRRFSRFERLAARVRGHPPASSAFSASGATGSALTGLALAAAPSAVSLLA